MRISVSKADNAAHKGLVAAVGWSADNSLYSCGDDRAVWCWNRNGVPVTKLAFGEYVFTDFQFSPSASQWNRSGSGSEAFALACTNGTLILADKGGRLERRLQAHEGAILCIRWNFDGTALASSGEDGMLKIWSRTGMLRSTLAHSSAPVYALAWNPESDLVLFGHGGNLIAKPFQSSIKEAKWEGHAGLILAIDWNAANNLIVSGGEDGFYKVWDCHGRLCYKSSKMYERVTSAAWCRSGEFFAVGSFNTIWLCDKTGWVLSKEKLSVGSLLRMGWTSDGAQLAAAGAGGFVVFCQLVDKTIEWTKLSVRLQDLNQISVYDMVDDKREELDFPEQVIKISLGFRHLVVATVNQCFVYSISNWKTPHIVDVKHAVILIKQCQRYFMTVDCFVGLHLFNYDGRHLLSPKCQGLRAESLNDHNVTMSNDTLALIDSTDHRFVRFLDATSGKVVGEPLRHALEIIEIRLNQVGPAADRKFVFIDRNQDLYMTPVFRHEVFRLATLVETVSWNDEADILAAMADQKIIVWYCPLAAYVDRDLLNRVKVVKEGDFGKSPKIQSFVSSNCTLRLADGACITSYICPYPFVLFQHVKSKQWDYAAQLCRFVKDDLLWACLAILAVNAQELTVAEEAYAAIDEVDKVQFMLYLKDLPLEEARQAEIALFKRHPDEAEALLLQAGLTYRAIHMNLKLFNWDRALELAVMHKVHIDTVMWYRQHYLMRIKATETKEQFLQLKDQVRIDPQKINAKIQLEMHQEANRAQKCSPTSNSSLEPI